MYFCFVRLPLKKDTHERDTGKSTRRNSSWKTSQALEEPTFARSGRGAFAMKAEELERAARSCKTSTGVGADGFHPNVTLDLSKETCETIVGFSCERGAMCLLALLFFLIPKNVTSERPIAFLPTLIRWWAWLPLHTINPCEGRYNLRAVPEEGAEVNGQAVDTSGWCEEIARQVGSWPWLTGLRTQDQRSFHAAKKIYAKNLLEVATAATSPCKKVTPYRESPPQR